MGEGRGEKLKTKRRRAAITWHGAETYDRKHSGGIKRAALLSLFFLLVLPQAQASASGGASIASAPLVVYGQQEFGNTASDGGNASPNGVSLDCDNGPNYESLWNLPVVAGDKVTIDYEGAIGGLLIFETGTTDYSVGSARYRESYPGENRKGEFVFSAPRTGIMPINFFLGCASYGPGPYDFTAADRHKLILSLAPRAYIIPTNTLTAQVHLADGSPAPDGLAFWLRAYWPRHGFAEYRAKTTGGTLRFPLALPASTEHQTVTFVVVRPAGAHYQTAKSALMHAHVNQPTPTHRRHRHHRRHHRHRHRHHRRIR